MMSFTLTWWLGFVSLMLMAVDDLKRVSWTRAAFEKWIKETDWKEFDNYGKVIAIFLAVACAPLTVLLLCCGHLVEAGVRRHQAHLNEALRKWSRDAEDSADMQSYDLKDNKELYWHHMRLAAKNIPYRMLKRISQQEADSKWTDKDMVNMAIDEMLERAITGQK